MEWIATDLNEPDSVRATTEAVRAFRRRVGERSLHGDPEWIMSSAAGSRLRLYVCRDGEDVVGYLPLRDESWALPYRFGEVRVFSYPLRRWLAPEPPVMDNERVGKQGAQRLLKSLFHLLSRELDQQQALFLQCVPWDSALHQFIVGSGDAKPAFRVIPYGEPYEHHVAHLPSDFDAYLRSLSRRTREGLRRSLRMLHKHVEGKMGVRRFSTESDVEHFLTDAVTVSKKTYQWHLLGLGLRDRAGLETSLRLSARKGWFCSYVLYLRDRPVAFMLGELHEGIYHYVDVGFDPEWADWSVGTVLHMEAIRDLIEGSHGVEILDFSQGTGEHKRRFGNHSRIERDYIILQRGWKCAAIGASYQGINRVSIAIVALLDRLHVKAQIKRFLRRVSAS